ncbi:YadA C-terminal domain-containing protein [Xenorhabdus siamensis]|uniref:YadA C-terminal domain-containing protein n=1 Tax=Xenorhabdus siamensis TaxID=3136254 RepID=UPI0030F3745B
MFNMKTTPRKLAILSVLISSVFSAGASADVIKVSGKDSKGSSVSDIEIYDKTESDTLLSGKADKTALDLKADKTALDLKADKTALDLKADKTELETALKTKVDKAELGTELDSRVDDVVKNEVVKAKVDDVVKTKVLESQVTLNKALSDETKQRELGDVETFNKAKGYTDQRFDTLQSYTDQKVNYLDNKIDRIEKRANAGVASVAAMSNIPYSNNTGFSLGLGLGQYRNGSAVALGIQDKLNENVSLRLSTSWNNSGSPVFGAGVGISW